MGHEQTRTLSKMRTVRWQTVWGNDWLTEGKRTDWLMTFNEDNNDSLIRLVAYFVTDDGRLPLQVRGIE